MSGLHAVIMAGGSGTRFWPASRKRRPKQFLPLARGMPLIQATVERVRGLVDPDHVWIVTNRVQAKGLLRLMPSFPADHIIVEPEPRDTAPCVALAVATIGARDPEATLITLPADHAIEPTDAFQRLLRRGIALASDHRTLVTFGIDPTHPATGFGWIETGTPLDDAEPQALKAVSFREKPDQATAERFLAAGNFLWNSGIFVWSIPAVRAAMDRAEPALAASCTAMLAALQSTGDNRVRVRNAAFRRAPKLSIDYAVMERAPQVAVVKAAVQWSDIGSFPALGEVVPADPSGNVVLTTDGARHVVCQSSGNVIYGAGRSTVALFGVRDLIVVAVGDVLMVCPKDRAADLKQLVAQVEQQGRTDLL